MAVAQISGDLDRETEVEEISAVMLKKLENSGWNFIEWVIDWGDFDLDVFWFIFEKA